MFNTKPTTSIMLACIVCSSLFLCAAEYLSGSEAWVAWGCTSALGIGALVFVLVSRRRKGKKTKNENINR